MTRLTNLMALGLFLGAAALALPALGQSDGNAIAGSRGMMSDLPNGGMTGRMMGMQHGMAENCAQMMANMHTGASGDRPNEQWRGSTTSRQ